MKPGSSGDILSLVNHRRLSSWKGWGHVRWFIGTRRAAWRAVPGWSQSAVQHDSEWAAISEVAVYPVLCAETVRKWVRQAQVVRRTARDRDRRIR